jgi:hypothetical protein
MQLVQVWHRRRAYLNKPARTANDHQALIFEQPQRPPQRRAAHAEPLRELHLGSLATSGQEPRQIRFANAFVDSLCQFAGSRTARAVGFDELLGGPCASS